MHNIVLDAPYFHMSAVALVHAFARCSEEGRGFQGATQFAIPHHMWTTAPSNPKCKPSNSARDPNMS